MGLDFQGSEAHWSYSGFMRFRERVAAEAGIADLHVWWSEGSKGADPITPLLDHSDCDGDLSPQDCATVAPRLREIVLRWPEDDYDRIHGLLLAEGMEDCANSGDPLVFC